MRHSNLGENVVEELRDFGSKRVFSELKKIINREFINQRECAEKLGISPPNLTRSMKKPTAKFIRKLEDAMGKKLAVIDGKEIQIIRSDNNDELKSESGTGTNKNEDPADFYKSIIDDKDIIIKDLKLIIENQKDIIRSLQEKKGG